MWCEFDFVHAILGGLSTKELTLEHLSDIVAIEKRSHLTAWSEANFKSSLASRHVVIGLFDAADTLLAYAVISLVAGEAELLLFVVDEALQGKKLGTEFLQQLINALQQSNKAQAFFLEVRAGNVPAITVYENLGFNQAGERPNYYSTPWGREDALVYVLDWSFG